MRIAANGTTLYFEEHGWDKEADVLVLSNGVLMSTASWAHQVAAFARSYRLLLYDCRGMWKSDHPPGPYSMELHADDLASLLDALKVERAHIAGISYGGEVSLAFARRHPERTQSLVVASAVSEIDPLLRAAIGAWVKAAEAKDPELLYDVVCPFTFSERWLRAHEAEAAAARARYRELDFGAVLELFQAFLRFDFTEQLRFIRAPTLVLIGEDDLIKPRRYSEVLAREIPNAEFLIVPHAGHALSWEAAEAFNTAVLGFLAKHAGNAAKRGGGS